MCLGITKAQLWTQEVLTRKLEGKNKKSMCRRKDILDLRYQDEIVPRGR
jgi:hypothetical protein